MKKEKKFDINYLGSNIVVKVLKDDWEIEDFYEELGDIDIVECNEISYDGESVLVDSARDVFKVPNNVFRNLKNNKAELILKFDKLSNYVDLNKPETRKFLAWYYATTTGHRDEEQEQRDAIKIMFEDAGWDCTDINTMQFRLELLKDKEYRFVQCNKYPDGTQDWVFEDYNIDEEEIETLVNACLPFGYSKEDVEKWISLGESTDLILECLFEMQN